MKNKLFRDGLALGIMFMFICAGAASAINTDMHNAGVMMKSGNTGVFDGDTYVVDDEGDGDFTTISDAVNYSNDGDIIEVYSGEYPEHNIIVDRTLDIRGIDMELGSGDDTGNPVINLSGEKTGFVLLADGVFISNLRIKNVSLGYSLGEDGAILIKSSFNLISDNTFFTDPHGELQGLCIYINNSNNNKVINNCFYNTLCGVTIFIGENNNISFNHFFGIGAVLLGGSDNNIIYGNVLETCRMGVVFEVDCDENIVSYNNFNFTGIVIYIVWSNSNRIEYNNFVNRGKITTFVSSHRTRWYGNYWENLPKGFPKIILGVNLYCIPWVNFDWHPATGPYDI
jgi:nitrous oxidase accessory protein NosD